MEVRRARRHSRRPRASDTTPAPRPTTQEDQLADRAAPVTGRSSGIGLAIARALGQDGYALTVSARRAEKLEEAVKGLRDEGIDVEAVPANMAREEDILALVKAHEERFGRMDVLINNAGVGIGGEI